MKDKKYEECLYFIDGPSMLANAIIHRLAYNKDIKASLMLSDSEFKKFGLYDAVINLKKNKIFDDLIWGQTLVETDDEDAVCKHFDSMLANNGKKLYDFQQIFCMNDDWGGHFSLYLILKRQHYIWLQSATETLCNPPREDNIPLVKKYQATSIYTEYAMPCLLEQSKNNIKNCNKSYSLWNNVSAFGEICEQTLELIGNSFMGKDQKYGNGTLLIRNSVPFVYTSNGFSPNNKNSRLKKSLMGYERDIWSNDVAINVDKMALDFYGGEGTKYIKYHLFDYKNEEFTKIKYGQNFSHLPQIPFQFMIPFFTKNGIKFDKVISYASTSTQLLEGEKNSIAAKNITLGKSFFKTWYFYDCLYMILSISQELHIRKIYASEDICEQLQNLSVYLNIKVSVVQHKEMASLQEKELAIYDSTNIPNERVLTEIIEYMKGASIIFLNVEEANNFIPYEFMNVSCPILLEKKMIDKQKEKPNFLRNEMLWVCSKISSNLEQIKNLKIQLKHENSGYQVTSRYFTSAESVLEFKKEYERKQISRYENSLKELTHKYDENERQLSVLTKYFATNINQKINGFNKETLLSIVEFDKYMEFVHHIREKYLIILSIKDTPGNNLTDEEIQRIREIGFSNLRKNLWQMYIGVSVKGVVICDISGTQPEEPVEYSTNFENLSVKVQSKAWRKGNLSSVNINGIEYAKNKRGINLIIYDIDNNELIDSIAYDAHPIEKIMYR